MGQWVNGWISSDSVSIMYFLASLLSACTSTIVLILYPSGGYKKSRHISALESLHHVAPDFRWDLIYSIAAECDTETFFLICVKNHIFFSIPVHMYVSYNVVWL